MNKMITTLLATTLCAGLAAEAQSSLLITGFVENSALQAAGAMENDLLLKYNGRPVHNIAELTEQKSATAGETVEVQLQRGDVLLTVSVPAGSLGVYLRTVEPDHAIEADAVRIEGIGRLGWDLDMTSTFLGCVYRLDEKYGRHTSYIDISGLSAYAFRFQIFSSGFCPSSPDATCGFDCGGFVLGALGYKAKILALDTLEAEEEYKPITRSQAELEELIITGIDEGWPTIGIDMMEIPEWGIVTGYQKDGEEFFCRTYYDSTGDYDLAEKFPWVVYLIEGYTQNDLQDAYRASLRKARELLQTKSVDDYHSGLAGYDRWMKHLGDIDQSTAGDESFCEAMHANWWIYTSLYCARRTAAPYLRAHPGSFGLAPADLEALAAIYDEEVKLLEVGQDNVPSEMMGGKPEEWTPELRQRQMETIGKLRGLEEQALSILKKI